MFWRNRIVLAFSFMRLRFFVLSKHTKPNERCFLSTVFVKTNARLDMCFGKTKNAVALKYF